MGRLTTHVLDLVSGRPAAGIRIELKRQGDSGGVFESVAMVVTNQDGRCDGALVEGDSMQQGIWELNFHVADYFVSQGRQREPLPFLDVVNVRFAIACSDQNYHVPLLVTPWSYSTYRGS